MKFILILFFTFLYFYSFGQLQNGYYIESEWKVIFKKTHVLKVFNDSIEYFTLVKYKGTCLMNAELVTNSNKLYDKVILDKKFIFITKQEGVLKKMVLNDSIKWVFSVKKNQIIVKNLKNIKFKLSKKINNGTIYNYRVDFYDFINPNIEKNF